VAIQSFKTEPIDDSSCFLTCHTMQISIPSLEVKVTTLARCTVHLGLVRSQDEARNRVAIDGWVDHSNDLRHMEYIRWWAELLAGVRARHTAQTSRAWSRYGSAQQIAIAR
jgi:hypothetical protein